MGSSECQQPLTLSLMVVSQLLMVVLELDSKFRQVWLSTDTARGLNFFTVWLLLFASIMSGLGGFQNHLPSFAPAHSPISIHKWPFCIKQILPWLSWLSCPSPGVGEVPCWGTRV